MKLIYYSIIKYNTHNFTTCTVLKHGKIRIFTTYTVFEQYCLQFQSARNKSHLLRCYNDGGLTSVDCVVAAAAALESETGASAAEAVLFVASETGAIASEA